MQYKIFDNGNMTQIKGRTFKLLCVPSMFETIENFSQFWQNPFNVI